MGTELILTYLIICEFSKLKGGGVKQSHMNLYHMSILHENAANFDDKTQDMNVNEIMKAS